MWRWRTCLLQRGRVAAVGLTVLGTVLGLVGAPAAMASTWSRDLLASSIRTDDQPVALVSLGTLSFTGGSHRYLSASYTVRNAQAFNILQGARIRCRRTADDAAFYSVFTTRNVTANGTSTVQVRWMFTVPATGAYACTLWGHAATSRGTGYRLAVTAGAIGLDGTRYRDGAEWRHATGGRVPTGGSAYLLRRTWTSTGLTRMGANADVELTNDYGSPNNGRSSTAGVSLYVTQLRADGTGCRPAVVVTTRATIPAAVHHDKVYLTARDVMISTAAGCTRNFAVKALVRSVSGNPLVLEGGSTRYSNGIAFSY